MSQAPTGPDASAPPSKPIITYDDFAKLDLRTARVLEATSHPNADKLICLKIDLGRGRQQQIIAGLREWYPPQQLVGKDIVVVANLAPRKMRGLESQGMLLAASDEQAAQRRVVVLTLDQPVPPGSPIS
jgi:methionyl-tRNA synthetase